MNAASGNFTGPGGKIGLAAATTRGSFFRATAFAANRRRKRHARDEQDHERICEEAVAHHAAAAILFSGTGDYTVDDSEM